MSQCLIIQADPFLPSSMAHQTFGRSRSHSETGVSRRQGSSHAKISSASSPCRSCDYGTLGACPLARHP